MQTYLKSGNKRIRLIEALREMIISGEFIPGSQFWSYEKISRTFNVSNATMQFAINQLKEDGFLSSIRRRGVFIAEKLPNRHRFALLLKNREENNCFWKILKQVAETSHADYEFDVICGFSEYHPDPIEKIRSELGRRQICGIIAGLPVSYWPEVDEVFHDHPEIPVVLCDSRSSDSSFISMNFNHDKFMEYACAELKAHGVRRAAVIFMDEQKEAAPLRQIAAGYGVEIPSYLWQHIHDHCRSSVTNLVELMLQLPQSRRPEAILIYDDNLLKHLGRGLEGRMAEFPDFPLIISHANFPNNDLYPFAVKQLGYDLKKFFEQAVTRMRQWYDTHDNSPIQLVPVWKI